MDTYYGFPKKEYLKIWYLPLHYKVYQSLQKLLKVLFYNIGFQNEACSTERYNLALSSLRPPERYGNRGRNDL